MSYSITNPQPKPDIQPYFTGAVSSVNQSGPGFVTGTVMYDQFGGNYSIASVNSQGYVQGVTQTTAPQVTGSPPPSSLSVFPATGSASSPVLSLNMAWTIIGNTIAGAGASPFSLPNTIVGNPVFTGTPTFPASFPGYVSGNWYQPLPVPQTAGGTALNSATTIVGFYGTLEEACGVANLALDITTSLAASSFQVAIYQNGSWGRPSTLVASASGSAAATGVIAAPVVANLAAQGYWWLYAASGASNIALGQSVSQGNPTLGYIGTSSSGAALGTGTLAAGVQTTGQTFGTWPAFTSATVWTSPTTTIVPVVAFQVSTP